MCSAPCALAWLTVAVWTCGRVDVWTCVCVVLQVPGAENLPAPDPISESKVAELSELVAVLGEYVVRCFYSKKPWTLRDAALQKVQLDLRGYEQPPAQVAKVVLALCTTAATYVCRCCWQVAASTGSRRLQWCSLVRGDGVAVPFLSPCIRWQ